MLTPEKINEMLEAATPSIIEGFKKEIKDSITYEVRQQAAEIVRTETTKWVKENIVPEMVKSLVESKEGLISVGAKLAPKIVEELVKGSTEIIKKKMESQWDRSKIMESFFK